MTLMISTVMRDRVSLSEIHPRRVMQMSDSQPTSGMMRKRTSAAPMRMLDSTVILGIERGNDPDVSVSEMHRTKSEGEKERGYLSSTHRS